MDHKHIPTHDEPCQLSLFPPDESREGLTGSHGAPGKPATLDGYTHSLMNSRRTKSRRDGG